MPWTQVEPTSTPAPPPCVCVPGGQCRQQDILTRYTNANAPTCPGTQVSPQEVFPRSPIVLGGDLMYGVLQHHEDYGLPECVFHASRSVLSRSVRTLFLFSQMFYFGS